MRQGKKYFIIKIGISIFVLIFAAMFMWYSFTDLSINVQQCLYGWENYYGFYEEEPWKSSSYRWTKSEASEVIEKKDGVLVVPLRAGNPDIGKKPLSVKIFIDNFPKRVIEIDNNSWQTIEIDLDYLERDKFTFTINVSRTWSPNDWNISEDSRELGIAVGEITFDK